MDYIIYDIKQYVNLCVINNKYSWCIVIITIWSIICMFIISGKNAISKLGLVFTQVYITVLLLLTIMMRPEKKISRQIHIYPLWTFVEMIKTGKLMFLWLSIENIMMFIPLGFAIETGMSDYQSKKRKVIAVFCASLVSLCIEIIQYRFNVGNCDVEDWINNTLGALIGVLCAEAIKKHKYGEFE